MKVCYICSSDNHVDDHHVDCQHGKVSPDTVPLCRRCHTTYHGLGIEWFNDEFLDRAIEVENMRRRIFSEPDYDKRDIVRSDYWYKKHGIKPERSVKDIRVAIVRTGMEPICGWQWIEENKGKIYPQQDIEVRYDGKSILLLPSTSTRRGLIRAAMTMARRSSSKKES